jgi:hypothetical protein
MYVLHINRGEEDNPTPKWLYAMRMVESMTDDDTDLCRDAATSARLDIADMIDGMWSGLIRWALMLFESEAAVTMRDDSDAKRGLGFALCSVEGGGNTVHLDYICTKRCSARGGAQRGVTLLKHIEHVALTEHVDVMAITLHALAPVIGFYRKQGFRHRLSWEAGGGEPRAITRAASKCVDSGKSVRGSKYHGCKKTQKGLLPYSKAFNTFLRRLTTDGFSKKCSYSPSDATGRKRFITKTEYESRQCDRNGFLMMKCIRRPRPRSPDAKSPHPIRIPAAEQQPVAAADQTSITSDSGSESSEDDTPTFSRW